MKRFTLFACLALALVFALSAFADDMPRYVKGSGGMGHGAGVNTAKAGRDTFLLMGPAGSGAPYIGDFETPLVKARLEKVPLCSETTALLGPTEWCQVDITQPTVTHWHRDTYFAVVGAYSAWCGDITIPSCDGGVSDPDGGYGSNWDDILEWRGMVDSNTSSTTLNISAVANIYSEPGYDGTTLQVEKLDQGFIDINYWDGVQPGIAISETATYLPADYMGAGADEVVVLWHFQADGAWDDSDCSFPSSGAIQLDSFLITSDNGVSTGYDPAGLVASTITWETSEGHDVLEHGPDYTQRPKGGIQTRFPVGVGTFASIWNQLEDADPCATNYSRQVAFIDDGTVQPGTGPSLGQTWLYGPNGYIVNTLGGLAGPTAHLHNAIYSPAMAWPDPTHRGALLQFLVYRHEDLSADAPGMFYTWHVKSTNDPDPNTIIAAPEENRNFVQYGGPDYLFQGEVVDDLLVTAPTYVQIRLACYELGYVWGWIGDDGYPAPYFDNVNFRTYPVVGPGIANREIDRAQDGFPANGTIDLADPNLLTVRFDMGQNISPPSHTRRDFGDSLVFDAVVTRPGAGLDGVPQLHYLIKRNTAFDPYRDSAPAGGYYQGQVDCGIVTGPAGAVVPDRYYGDLPDGWDYTGGATPTTDGTKFLFPGDQIHWYISATDTAGGLSETAILPADTTGFSDFVDPMNYNPSYNVQCLPTITDAVTGEQPPIVFWNDFGNRGGRDEWYSSFAQLGLLKGVDFDAYYTNGPSSGIGNGLGGKGTAQQLANYDVLLYTAGDLGVNTVSNGDFENDSGQDVQTLTQWFDGGGKGAYMTGDDLAADMAQSGLLTAAFLADYMNESFTNTDVAPLITGQVAPRVVLDTAAGTPNPVFTSVTSWIAFGGCPVINIFDAVEAIDGPNNGSGLRVAEFTDPSGITAPYDWSACTLATGIGTAGTSSLISMPYDFMFIYTDPNEVRPAPKVDAYPAARVRVLKDVLGYYSLAGDPLAVSSVPDALQFGARNYPNPFNPKTTITYVAPRSGHLSLKVYNVRGQLVRTLINSVVESGTRSIEWDGSDNHGSKVASGVYFYEARMGNDVIVNKMALVK